MTNDKKCNCLCHFSKAIDQDNCHCNPPVEDKREEERVRCVECGGGGVKGNIAHQEKCSNFKKPQNQDWLHEWWETVQEVSPQDIKSETIKVVSDEDVAHLLLETEQRHDEELKNWIECNRCIECKQNKGVSVCIPCRNRFRDKAVSEVKRELAEKVKRYFIHHDEINQKVVDDILSLLARK